MTNKVSLSIAMIVKNEQKNLQRCLESIKDIGAELIVVDTGSVDQTVKIAKDYGAKVYYHPWEDDFAKHRNQSFSYATGDWIMQLDADEELIFNDNRHPRILISFLSHVKRDMNALAFPCVDIEKGNEVARTLLTRLFRNGKVTYKRTIHNEPMFKGNVGICSVAYLKHYGYDLEPHEKKVKADRTIRLLKESLDKDPKDYDSMFYLSQAYYSYAQDREKSVKWAVEYARHRSKMKKGKFMDSVYWTIISYYLDLPDLKKAWKWIEIALKEIPGDLDISMALMKYGILTKNQSLLGAGARAFVTGYQNFEKTAADRGSRFVFSYNINSYAFALFHLATTYLEHSVKTLSELYSVIGELNPEFIQEIQDGLNLWFSKNESILKYNDAMFSATKTARTLYKVGPGTNRSRLRASVH